jgi:hypothetical protein
VAEQARRSAPWPIRDWLWLIVVLVVMTCSLMVIGFNKNRTRVEHLDRRLDHIEQELHHAH